MSSRRPGFGDRETGGPYKSRADIAGVCSGVAHGLLAEVVVVVGGGGGWGYFRCGMSGSCPVILELEGLLVRAQIQSGDFVLHAEVD